MEASGQAYTEALSELYPTRADVAAEIAELEGRLTLPRSTELFASDIHGEYNAFSHVLRGGSGAVRALVEDVFGSTLNDDEKAALLRALQPFLRPERWAKVEKAIQITRLSRVIRAAMQLFREKGYV